MRRMFLLVWLICALVMTTAFAQVDEIKEKIETRNPMIRVHLTKLGLEDRLDITLSTSYILKNQKGEILASFQPKSDLSFQLRDEGLYLYYEGMVLPLGNDINLERVNSQTKEGWRRTNFSTLYMGDLRLKVSDKKLMPILNIQVEDYLLGVVPYEMSNSFPLEALKAQAVAARTYALRNQNSDALYDVTDNTNDQVFYGYLTGNDRAEKAIRDTYGICGFDQEKLAQCYYAASNGGQMELPQTVWPSRETLTCYAFGEDPYDLENPESPVRKLTLQKKYKNGQAPYAIRSLVAELLSEKLSEFGYDTSPESIRVDEVLQVIADTPATLGSKKMTMIRLLLRISGRTRHEVRVQIADPDTEEVSLFSLPQTTDSPNSSPTFAPVVTVEPTASPQPVYGPFTPVDEDISLDIPIFPVAEEAFGMDILSHYDNEIWSVDETKDAFVIEARRYGHGVGTSQRGAQQMAQEYHKSYVEILNFYYPGMQLARFAEQMELTAQVDEALLSTAGPAPSPTPRPTLMPVTMEAKEGQYFASVTGISEDSSLNLRAEPSLNGKIVMRLYKGQRLLVAEECAQEGWVKVQTDSAEGYVVKSYLTQETAAE